MINKEVKNISEAIMGVKSGMTLMFGGFGLCGIAENSIMALSKKEINNLICISNGFNNAENDIEPQENS